MKPSVGFVYLFTFMVAHCLSELHFIFTAKCGLGTRSNKFRSHLLLLTFQHFSGSHVSLHFPVIASRFLWCL